jgi:hypothetical protein
MTQENLDKQNPPLSWIKSPHGVVEVYANTTHIVWSLDDLRIRLGQLVGSPDTPNPGPEFKAVVEERAAVTFSWRNAVLLRDNLSALIKAYEETNGPIRTDVKLVPAPI